MRDQTFSLWSSLRSNVASARDARGGGAVLRPDLSMITRARIQQKATFPVGRALSCPRLTSA